MAQDPKRSERNNRTVLRISPPSEHSTDLDEYAYVVRDLRRVGVLAGLMFALLIGLSFLLR